MAQQNDHVHAERLFSAYMDQRVTTDEKAFVERHVAACADCRAKLQATRVMVSALRNMPMVKAPRSFVLPREMERKAKPSIWSSWYPALRLATVVAALAFVFVFASDLLTVGSGFGFTAPAAVPAAAPAPAFAAPTGTPELKAFAAAPAQPTAAPNTAAGSAEQTARSSVAATQTISDGTELPVTNTLQDTATAALAQAAQPTPTMQPTVIALAPPSANPSLPETATQPTTQPFDVLRVIEITLAGLVIVLFVATLIARRHNTKSS